MSWDAYVMDKLGHLVLWCLIAAVVLFGVGLVVLAVAFLQWALQQI